MQVVAKESGRLDVLVNNAGIMNTGPLIEAELNEARSMYETNVFGAIAMAQAAAKLMVQQVSEPRMQAKAHQVTGVCMQTFLLCVCCFTQDSFCSLLHQRASMLGFGDPQEQYLALCFN